MTEERKIRFQPFSSVINPSFWQRLIAVKLNDLKLSQDPVQIHGSYACNQSERLPCLASFDYASFDARSWANDRSSCPLTGKLICTNVKQEFIDYDKKNFLENIGKEIWTSIFDGSALQDPEGCLSKFGLIVFGDLKKYDFFYWFAFPALNYPKDVFGIHTDKPILSLPITQVFNDDLLKTLQKEYDKPSDQRSFQRGYFIVKHTKDDISGNCDIRAYPLSQYRDASQDSNPNEKSTLYFAFTEPSANQIHPGWPLRNFLCLIAVQFKLNQINVIRLRRGLSKAGVDLHCSVVMKLEYQPDPVYQLSDSSQKVLPDMPQVTGWERNESQQLLPMKVNLSKSLDPKRLAEDAVNLNLKLMKWRLLPDLDLEKIAETKCLLLGCGTLGCHVARGLLAWGVKNISIVDNARVSYSNPVRQTLYSFDECASGKSVYKSVAAAESLRKIHPTINVQPYVFSIPMPGHQVAEKELVQTEQDVETLENLIESHDAIFLLMDTRESRWLPTVIAMAKKKLVINAAIGFDTFLLQRYGIREYLPLTSHEDSTSSTSQISSGHDSQTESSSPSKGDPNQLPSDQLGCYFCNDIVAPGDSTLDRTLDQQCTVSRPGVSMMVSAMAVELLASVVSTRLGPLTPAPIEIQNDASSISDEDCGSALGIVPHSIRGNVARYHIYMPTSPCFNRCSACSPAVVNSYKTTGFPFLRRVFDDPSYLEEVAGLKELQNVTDNVWALDSDDEIERSNALAREMDA